MNEYNKKISKRMSYALRHQPEKFGLKLDAQGWCEVTDLLKAFQNKGMNLTFEKLEKVVIKNDKKRFAFNENKTRIRASQGHSIKIDLGYKPEKPPEILYHGTAERFLDSIMEQGLQKRNRHHVHLSANKDTAVNVGSRHGKAVILIVKAKAMHDGGIKFYKSQNGVWLTEEVKPGFLVVDGGG